MIPFALLGFGGGNTPLPFGIKKVSLGGGNTGQIWALMTNGDLYVTGSPVPNGLGRTEAGVNVLPAGWTLTNTGVSEFWPLGGYNGGLCRKGAGVYEYTTNNSPPYFPITADELRNSWNVLPSTWQEVDGRKVLDDAAYITAQYMVQPDGAVYRMVIAGPVLHFAEKVAHFNVGGQTSRVLLDGTLQYSGSRGTGGIGGSGESGTGMTNLVLTHPDGKKFVRAKTGRGQTRNSAQTGADQLTAIIALDEDGKWYGLGNIGDLGVYTSNVGGTVMRELTAIPPNSEIYVNGQYSQTWPQLSWRGGLQSFLVNKELGLYQSAGLQGTQFGGRYSLFRNLAVTSSAKVFTDVDQAILDDGGIDYVVEGTADQFGALVSGNGHIFWCGAGYTGANWPVPFRVASSYNGRLDDDKLLPPTP